MSVDEEITIRPAVGTDADVMAGLWLVSFLDTFAHIMGDKAQAFLKEWLACDPSVFAHTTVACANGVFAGYIQLEAHDGALPVGTIVRRQIRQAGLVAGVSRRHLGLMRVLPCLARLALVDWQPFPADALHVKMLGVGTAWRKRGIGGRLLEHAQAEAQARNLARITLGVVSGNTTAIRLYERHGFVRGPERHSRLLHWAGGFDRYFIMTKKLT